MRKKEEEKEEKEEETEKETMCLRTPQGGISLGAS
jgi:hypothetical protein